MLTQATDKKSGTSVMTGVVIVFIILGKLHIFLKLTHKHT